MINNEPFKKQFPDVQVQKITTNGVLGRAAIEQKVLFLVTVQETGLLYYSYSVNELTIFTSKIFKEKLDAMIVGTVLTCPRTGTKWTVVSSPVLEGREMSFLAEYNGRRAPYHCSYFM